MPSGKRPISEDPALDEAALNLFWLFARMEYALKAVGFLRVADGDAQADWDQFATSIDQRFWAREAEDKLLADAVAYILHEPPKKQVAEAGSLYWRTIVPTSASKTGVLLKYVARIRNNLFHGGKFGGRWLDPGRSGELLPRVVSHPVV